ncbi:sodium:proton antiporter [Weissella koreensis]|uniref:cation:proton antiporter n=1 Tax=Weissella koreensis TaxID=165096 RepID=UPI000CF32158|nr:sodium:proton antiporter [Weissella koreensis]AVH75313.1 sodium:proton antiporter [Weissella koreensis]MCZ9311160.1 sodium:proton antiporter [Weissella koreensis]
MYYIVALLVIGVVGTNIVKQFIPKIPEAFILILVGILLSYTKIFNGFELEPEFFMVAIIAPLMFVDGQRQSIKKIRERFSLIFVLSVVLAAATVLIVGLMTNFIETKWTLPMAIALAAIVTPTDAVAVKSMTSGSEMPSGVGEALELESLFNDATGLVILDLALSVLGNQNLSIIGGINHFLFVAIGGILIGLIGGWLIVMLRVNLNFWVDQPEISIIPISLLTPFVIYLIAEHFGTSGILAVVATGIIHNWEANRLRLSSTRVQVSQSIIWSTISEILNSVVFLFLGIALPDVARKFFKMDNSTILLLLGLSGIIYVMMFLIRYIWAQWEHEGSAQILFGANNTKQHTFYSKVFAVSGIHGTMTLAMAFSLPKRIGGVAFPYREELIIVASIVILFSMLVSAIVLPILLPVKKEDYTAEELNHFRGKMVDFAILQIRGQIEDRSVREALTSQLLSQKGWGTAKREVVTQLYQTEMIDMKDFVSDYIHSSDVRSRYSKQTITIYEKMVDRIRTNGDKHLHNRLGKVQRKRMRRNIKHLLHEIKWHAQQDVNDQRSHYDFSPKQKRQIKQNRAKYEQFKNLSRQEMLDNWKNMQNELLDLNEEVAKQTDQKINGIMEERLRTGHGDNQSIDMVRKSMETFFNRIRRDYKQAVEVDNNLFLRAFQYEFTFVQQGVEAHKIPQALAAELYTEINDAQTLQIQRAGEMEQRSELVGISI